MKLELASSQIRGRPIPARTNLDEASAPLLSNPRVGRSGSGFFDFFILAGFFHCFEFRGPFPFV
jgi:hypothetical protein